MPQSYAQQSVHFLYDEALVRPPLDALFDRERLQDTVHNTLGRGSALMFSHQGVKLVLKHYRRGGLLGRWVSDSYIFTGLKATRMWREFELLQRMRELDLPVPRPAAARIQRVGALTYQGDLLTEAIADSRTLAEALSQAPLPESLWAAIGQTLARFHQHDVYHADLNANNILLDAENRVLLIDFDKGAFRPAGKARWTQANLDRLLRSLNKLQGRLPVFHFANSEWQTLEAAYAKAGGRA